MSKSRLCQRVTLSDALRAFVLNRSGTQAGAHIKPLHWYVACRLVLEGGFLPDEVMPRPPLVVVGSGRHPKLAFDVAEAGGGEQTVLGGLKTKAVDVVVTKAGVGPVLAISIKGTLNAFRNLTNRMEEAAGDCANLHITYPALVYGFLHILRGTRAAPRVQPNDTAIQASGAVVDAIQRYHDVLVRLAERRDLRNEATRYEAIALGIASTDKGKLGSFVTDYPALHSPLQFNAFFDQLYRVYDLRYVFSAPNLEARTRRVEWAADSAPFEDKRCRGLRPRTAPKGPERG